MPKAMDTWGSIEDKSLELNNGNDSATNEKLKKTNTWYNGEDAWKKNDTVSGWNNEDEGWNDSQPGKAHYTDKSGTYRNSFLIKRLGLDFQSIFDGEKTLTKRSSDNNKY